MRRINLAKPRYNPAWEAQAVEKELIAGCDTSCDRHFTIRRALIEAFEAGKAGRELMAEGVGI